MSITELVESPAYKKVMAKVYGIGAAVVILGALWKILHLPGAAAMLIAGLGTEAVIFFLSAFEPPHEMPDWSLVYPELVGLDPKADSHGAVSGGGSELQALIQTGNIDQATVDQLSEGIKKLSVTSSQLANLGDASLATENYLNNMNMAAESVGKLSNIQNQTVTSMETLASSTHGVVEGLSVKGDEYTQQLSNINTNLASINSVYELQLQGSKAQAETTQELVSGMAIVKSQFDESVENAKLYKEQVAQLSKTVGELNSIYGNMLSAMNR